MDHLIDWDKFLKQTLDDKDKKRRAAINFHIIRQKQFLSLVDLSELFNVSEEDLIAFERNGECSEHLFNQIIDWMLEVLNKIPD